MTIGIRRDPWSACLIYIFAHRPQPDSEASENIKIEGKEIRIFGPSENISRLSTKTNQIWPPAKEKRRLKGHPLLILIVACREFVNLYNAPGRNLQIGLPS